MDVSKLKRSLNIKFDDDALLTQAFTHSSYVNEHRKSNFSDNERLEFLGDAVLELTVSEYLFSQHPSMPEGELTKLRAIIVCEDSLYKFAKGLNFGEFILLGRGEERTGGRERPALLADAFEAFLGSLYLDQGFQSVVMFLKEHIYPKINDGAFSHVMDYKSKLQEVVQRKKNQSAEYIVVEEKGPSHNKEFYVEVTIQGSVAGQGHGHTKKEAEQRAAKAALDTLN